MTGEAVVNSRGNLRHINFPESRPAPVTGLLQGRPATAGDQPRQSQKSACNLLPAEF